MLLLTADKLSVIAPQVAGEVEEKIGIVQQFINGLPQKAFNLGIRVVFALIFFLIGSWIIKLIRKLVKKSLKKANADAGVIPFLDSLIKVLLYFVLIFMIASGFGLDAASVVAVVGSAGVAIGLALQGSLSNFAGGVLILLLKPFRVGDYIREDNNGNEGTVTEIQLFYTKLLTFDERVVILPNGALANTSLTNVTATPLRRLDMPLQISYRADIEKAKKIVLALLTQETARAADKEYTVFVNEWRESSIELIARLYVKNEDYFDAKARLLEKIKLAFDEQGIEIPYKQVDVHLCEAKKK